jgi:hypothetical protein
MRVGLSYTSPRPYRSSTYIFFIFNVTQITAACGENVAIQALTINEKEYNLNGKLFILVYKRDYTT